MKFRIITNQSYFKVQYRKWLMWFTVQEPEDLDNKYFGGDKCFDTKDQAQTYIDSKTPKAWTEVK